MRWFAQIAFQVKSLFSKRKLDEQLSEEIRTHVAMATEANVAAGMTPEEARYAVLREFGNVVSIQERSREGRGWVWVEQFGQDWRYAVRSLRKSPGFAMIAILSLALGIGANTALFSLIDEVLLRSLPVKNPDELVVFRWLSNALPVEGMIGQSVQDQISGLPSGTQFPLPVVEALRDQASLTSDVFYFAPLFDLTVVTDAGAERASGQLVTGNYFSGLGVPAWRGRMLNLQDDLPGAAPVAVIGYRFWQQSLGGQDGVIGKEIKVNQLSFTIVGVMPQEFLGTLEAGLAPDVTLPMSHEPQLHATWSWMSRPHIWWLHVMGRLKPGVDAEQARAELEPAYLHAVQEARKVLPPRRGGATVEPKDMFRLESGRQGLVDMRRSYWQPLMILLGIVGLVLLLACLNVANLLLARSLVRRREIAVRLSLGATRGRIIRQLLTESTLLALAGGGLGLMVAWWGRQGLLQLWPVGDSGALAINLRVLGFTLLLSLITGLVFGLAPAWRTTLVDLNTVLKGGGEASRGGLRGALTVAQVALSMILLIGAGLFVGTLRNLRGIETGFDRTNLLRFQLNAGDAGYSPAQASTLFDRIRARLMNLSGVQAAGFSSTGGISPDYRRTMGIPLLAGRDLTEHDGAGGPLVALVNETLAKTRFPGSSAIGHQYTIKGSSAMRTPDRVVEIVGVIGDTRDGDARQKIRPFAYVPYAQNPLTFSGAAFCLRTLVRPETLAADIRRVVRELEPAISVEELQTEEQQLDHLLARERLFALLSAWFGGLALLLTCIGLYGLLAHEVTARTKEIGIRMAIGAQSSDAVRLVLRSGIGLVVLGCLLGVTGSLAITRLMSKFLYGVAPTDSWTFSIVAVVLLVVASVACWLPARRAAKVDPIIALRVE